MKLLSSKKLQLSPLYFITNREEIIDIPIGVPFIYGDSKDEEYIVRMLEYEVLWQKAQDSGLPFNFERILRDNGYTGLREFEHCHPMYMDFKSSELDMENYINSEDSGEESLSVGNSLLKQYVNDTVAYLDVKVIKELNIFPIWLDTIEEAVVTNIHNFALYNPYMYNKKLGGMYGGLEMTSPRKNLFIFDISCSIPKGIGAAFLILGKNLAETFYADIMITGRKTVLIPYEELHTLDIDTAYEKWGDGQEAKMFKELLTSDVRHYGTAIVTGDNNHPGDNWSGSGYISDEDGKEMCKWEIDKLISMHTEGTWNLAGYSRWFEPKETERIDNWCKYLK